jgi:WD40 repeat protein
MDCIPLVLYILDFAPFPFSIRLGGNQSVFLRLNGSSAHLHLLGGSPLFAHLVGAISPNGDSLAYTCEDGGIMLCNLQTKQTPRLFSAHAGDIVTALALSTDGHTLVSGNTDTVVKVWRTNPAPF